MGVLGRLFQFFPLTGFILWLISLNMDVAVLHGRDTPNTVDGGDMLTLGWMGPLMGHFGWYANLLLPLGLGLLMLERGRPFQYGIGVALLLLALNSVFLYQIPLDSGSSWPNEIVAFKAGYFLWMVALVLVGTYLVRANRLGPVAKIDEDQ